MLTASAQKSIRSGETTRQEMEEQVSGEIAVV